MTAIAAQLSFTTNGSGFRDPAFAENKLAPVHRWTPWIAGFSAQFVEDVFREYIPKTSSRSPVVLDPFAGVGTTLVQAMLHNYSTIGFEINPYAALVTQTKLKAVSIDLAQLDAVIRSVERLKSDPNGTAPAKYRPHGFRSRIPFFSNQIEPQVLRLLKKIDSIPDDDIADITRIAFGSVMVRFSNYTYEPSLGSRPGAGKPLIENADVPAIVVSKLREIRDDITWLKRQGIVDERHSRHSVYCADFLNFNTLISDSSVDLLVTSPPYMNNYHYVRNTRPQLYWLSMLPDGSTKDLEFANFGKYWQTVRGSEPIGLDFNHAELQQTIKDLRKTRLTSGAYGGPGWANYVASYFNDCHRFVEIIKRVMRRGGRAVIVIGNSIIQGIQIPTDEVLGDLANKCGLLYEKRIVLRTKRVGSSITTSSVRRGEKNRVGLYETAIVLRKR
jgi:DNA methylase